MSYIYSGFLILCLAANAVLAQGWTLVWSDEFTQPDGSAPDSSKWDYDIGGGGWGNEEIQYYTSRTNNARIENGHLVIEAKQENYGGRNHTSARLLTKGKGSWTYGRIEGRIKVPRGQGIWPAFWMLGANIDSAKWPNCGEIDIMENIGKEPSTVHGTIHGPGYSGGDSIGGRYDLDGGQVFADDFHVFAVEWETNRIRWYVDGQLYFTATPSSLPAGKEWVFTGPEFIILNVAVGGRWPGYPDASTTFPQRMLVDYVRVYSSTNVPGCGGNALSNPGFEQGGLAGWSAYGAGFNTSVAANPVRQGTNSFKVFGQYNGGVNHSGIFQDRPCAPGEAFTCDGWMTTPGNDRIAGGNTAWIEVSFRNSSDAILSLYRTALFGSGTVPDVWHHLTVTNQIELSTYQVSGSVTNLVAPAGAAFVRAQVVYGQILYDHGAVFVDDLTLNAPGPTEFPVVVATERVGTKLRFSFPTFLSSPYQLQYKDSLSDSIWMPLETISGNGQACVMEASIGSSRRFFRVMRLCY